MSTAIMHQSALNDLVFKLNDLDKSSQYSGGLRIISNPEKTSSYNDAQYYYIHELCGMAPTTDHLSLSRTRSLGTAAMNQHRRLERAVSEPAATLQQQQQQQQQQQPGNASRYKTELCRPYEEAGTCKYGDKCQFAHGMRELRNLQRHPKYKTELCRTFHSVGFCPYGPRCHFVHNAEEARSPAMASTASSSLSRSPADSVSSFFPSSPSSSPRTSPPPSPEDTRLPVFNRLSAAMDALSIA